MNQRHIVALFAVLVGCAAPADGSDPATPESDKSDNGASTANRQHAISRDKTSAPNGFYEYLPSGYNASHPAPLLVFWHGIGENGDGLLGADGTGQLTRVLANGPPKLIAANAWPSSRPFVVLSPQHGPQTRCPTDDEIDSFITWAIANYHVDPRRIYLTALSCGASGSWSYLSKYQDKVVAAALLISGNPGDAWTTAGCDLISGDLAIWSVHGTMDPTVPIGPDQSELANLAACPAPHADVKWTEIPDGSHDVWTQTYDLTGGNGDVYKWLLAHPKP